MSVDWRAWASKNKMATYEQALKFYRKTPVKALEHLRALWMANRDDLKGGHIEITLMVNALKTHMLECEASPSAQAEFWEYGVATELPLVVLDIIGVSCFYSDAQGWLKLILFLNGRVLDAWLEHGFASPENKDGRSSGNAKKTVVPDSMVARYFHSLGTTWNTLWDERDRILDDSDVMLFSEPGEPRMSTSLCVFACSLTELHGHLFPLSPVPPSSSAPPSKQISGQGHFEATKLALPMLQVVLACWTMDAVQPKLKPGIGHVQCFRVITHFAHALEAILAEKGHPKGSNILWRPTIDAALDGIGHQKFMRAYCTALSSWPNMVGIYLEAALQALGYIVGFHQELQGPLDLEEDVKLPTRKACWEQPMISAIANALERESRVGPVPPFEGYLTGARATMVTYSCDMLTCTYKSLMLSEKPPTVDGASVYRIFSQSLPMLCSALRSNDEMERGNSPNAVRALKGTCNMWTVAVRDGWPDESALQTLALRRIRKGLLAAAEASWRSDMQALRAQQGNFHGNKDYDTILLTWSRFGEAWGLEEMAESDWRAAQHKHLCAWIGCEFHIRRSPTPLSTCKGCGERNYCSRECQIKDWKKGGHREKCRRLPAA